MRRPEKSSTSAAGVGEVCMDCGEMDVVENNNFPWRMRKAMFIRAFILPAMSRHVQEFTVQGHLVVHVSQAR